MNCEQQEWIDLYLFGELEGEDLLRFEAKMQEDEDFREDLRLQAEIFLGISTYHAAKSKTPTKVVKHSFKRVWMGIAAAIVFASMLGLMHNNFNIQQQNIRYAHNDYHMMDYGIIKPFKDKFVLPHLPSWVIKPLPELI